MADETLRDASGVKRPGGLVRLTRAAMARRAWIVIGAVLVVTEGAYLISNLSPSQATTESVVLVPSGAGRAGPGSAAEATRLAVTYAAAIPSDDGVLKQAAERLHTTPNEISDSITVRNEPNTALLRIGFSADSESEALQGASAILASLSSATPRARSVAGNSLLLVRPPRLVSGTTGKTAVLVIGVVLGLLAGFGLASLAERLNPRIDEADQLGRALECEAIALSALFPGGAGGLLERWRSLSGSPAPWVAVLAGSSAIQHDMSGVGERLRQALESDGIEDVRVVDASGPAVTSAPSMRDDLEVTSGVVLVVVGKPGEARFVEWAAAVADVVVIAVQRGAREAELISDQKRLRDLAGRTTDWGLLVVPAQLPPSAGAGESGKEPVGSAGASRLRRITQLIRRPEAERGTPRPEP
jgi:capsular polysaccharide biosynthesis protein